MCHTETNENLIPDNKVTLSGFVRILLSMRMGIYNENLWPMPIVSTLDVFHELSLAK